MHDELFKKYTGASTPMEYPFEKEMFYKTFLTQTDFIVSKMSESYITGDTKTEVKAKYAEIIEARQYCRDQINALQSETEESVEEGSNVQETE